jgi:hypothetical protein
MDKAEMPLLSTPFSHSIWQIFTQQIECIFIVDHAFLQTSETIG